MLVRPRARLRCAITTGGLGGVGFESGGRRLIPGHREPVGGCAVSGLRTHRGLAPWSDPLLRTPRYTPYDRPHRPGVMLLNGLTSPLIRPHSAIDDSAMAGLGAHPCAITCLQDSDDVSTAVERRSRGGRGGYTICLVYLTSGRMPWP